LHGVPRRRHCEIAFAVFFFFTLAPVVPYPAEIFWNFSQMAGSLLYLSEITAFLLLVLYPFGQFKGDLGKQE
jgi:hypothetical protein